MAGYFLELIGEVGDAAVVQEVGDLGEGEPVAGEHLFDAFDLVVDIEPFDGDAQCLGEQVGHIRIVVGKLFAEISGQVEERGLFRMTCLLEDEAFYGLEQDGGFVPEQVETRFPQGLLYPRVLLGCKVFPGLRFAQFNVEGMQPKVQERGFDGQDTSTAYHIFDIYLQKRGESSPLVKYRIYSGYGAFIGHLTMDTHTELSARFFPVVGIGASAGGLDAFKRLVKNIPERSGIAFILVQHLEPTHESMLTDILQKLTRIPVQEIKNNVLIEPDNIYIIPSNKLLTANDGRLQLSERRPKHEMNMPIDVFFSSLAEVYHAQAVGVILSGSGMDGTLGLKEIRGQGGLTYVQEPGTASFEGMPQSAIDADAADFVLPPEEIAGQLSRLTETLNEGAGDEAQAAGEEAFRELLYILRVQKGTDFTYYKQPTIRRRIARRMDLIKSETVGDYLDYFRENTGEQDLLYQDLLIPVTGFFRDAKVYETLSQRVFPHLLEGRSRMEPFRIWVAGCSTGEEPYSMAISLREYLKDRVSDNKIQIFASDVSEKSLAKARAGIYSKRDLEGLDAGRLDACFIKVGEHYQVDKSIRDMCVFACHNFLKDPPFAKMDLVSCRNVLIYMEPFLQKRALTTFHYALKEGGYLLLGRSETIAPAADLFTTAEGKDKLYIRKGVPSRFMYVSPDRNERGLEDRTFAPKKDPGREDFHRSADEALVTAYAPPGVVVNDQLDIVQFRGSTGLWLEPSPGKPSVNLLKMAREGLGFELRNILHKARESRKMEIKEHIAIEVMGRQQWVTLEVIPLVDTAEPYYLVLFKGIPIDPESGVKGPDEEATEGIGNLKNAERRYILQLEKELAQLREDMRSITENQEAVNEELQSANEELLSGSEELQSLNEELETSKEEIQSTNEELTTLNHELLDRNEQLNQREQDLLSVSRELERKVEERTSSLMEANILLKRSNASLEQYATIASHDLQEPLRKIRTFAATLNERHSSEIDSATKELLKKISVSADRMSVLIQEVLNFSKVLDASIFEQTDLDVILDRVVGDFDVLIAQKGAVIRRGRLPVIRAVPLQMNQLLYNLLGNALKFTRTGVPPVIDISSRMARAEEVREHGLPEGTAPYLEIVFRDNGIGFDRQFARQIFLIFQRLNPTDHFEGTGIGLALCQRIVTNHGGAIRAEGEKGSGARFTVVLPLDI